MIATQVGGPIALVKNGDPIVIDASPDKRSIDVLIDEQEMERRKVGGGQHHDPRYSYSSNQ